MIVFYSPPSSCDHNIISNDRCILCGKHPSFQLIEKEPDFKTINRINRKLAQLTNNEILEDMSEWWEGVDERV